MVFCFASSIPFSGDPLVALIFQVTAKLELQVTASQIFILINGLALDSSGIAQNYTN